MCSSNPFGGLRMCDCPFTLEALTCVRAPFRAALRMCSVCVCKGFSVPALPCAIAFAVGGLNTCACPVHTLIATQSKQAVAPCPRTWGSRNGRFANVIRACPLTCLKLCVCKNNSSRSTPAVNARRMHTRNGLYRHGARRYPPPWWRARGQHPRTVLAGSQLGGFSPDCDAPQTSPRQTIIHVQAYRMTLQARLSQHQGGRLCSIDPPSHMM